MIERKFCLLGALVLTLSLSFESNLAVQIPGQLAEDFIAGKVPSADAIAQLEIEVAANPDDLRLTRKLGKGYFFQFFGKRMADSVPKAQAMFERALALQKDDPETLAYLGSLYTLRAQRLDPPNSASQKSNFESGFELLQRAERLAPSHGAVLSITSASYLYLPDSYGMAGHVVEMLEGMRKSMGPVFKRFSHHGQQRLLLTLGQAYARTGKDEKARATFAEALAVNQESPEADMIKVELAKLQQ